MLSSFTHVAYTSDFQDNIISALDVGFGFLAITLMPTLDFKNVCHVIQKLPEKSSSLKSGFSVNRCCLYCIVLYSSIYIAPLNSHGQTEALLV